MCDFVEFTRLIVQLQPEHYTFTEDGRDNDRIAQQACTCSDGPHRSDSLRPEALNSLGLPFPRHIAAP